jgi:sulfide:quinone oxidoreductase
VVDIIQLEPEVAVARQLVKADFAALAARGFRAVVALRPDGEAPDQLPQAEAAQAAALQGLAFRYHPVTGVKVTDDDNVATVARLMDELPSPVLFYCGTGTRCTVLWCQAAAPRLGVETVLTAARNAGYALDVLRDTLLERADWLGVMRTAPGAPAFSAPAR